jgi:hypothetical protein
MSPKEQPLRIGDGPDGVREVAMRWTASHQQGWALFFDDEGMADPFCAHTLFEALALYRGTIEGEGWRLLHAAARADCWPDPRKNGFRVQLLIPGREEGEAIECFAPAGWDEVADLATQRANFDAWMASLAPVPVGRARPRAGHAHDPACVEFGPLGVMAGEYLVDGKANLERLLARTRARRR